MSCHRSGVTTTDGSSLSARGGAVQIGQRACIYVYIGVCVYKIYRPGLTPQDPWPTLRGPCRHLLPGVPSFWCFSAQNKVRILPELPSAFLSYLSGLMGRGLLAMLPGGFRLRKHVIPPLGCHCSLPRRGDEMHCLSGHWCMRSHLHLRGSELRG